MTPLARRAAYAALLALLRRVRDRWREWIAPDVYGEALLARVKNQWER